MVAILAGRPASESEGSWKALHDKAAILMERARKKASFNASQSSHRRGEYPVLSTGASFGGGQRVSRCPVLIGHDSNSARRSPEIL